MDDDIISQGGDREPRQFPRVPRRLAVMAAVVLAAVAGVVYVALPRHQHEASAVISPSAPAPAGTPIGAAPSPITISGDVPGGSDGIQLRAQPWGDGLRLPVGGTRPAWFSPATGRSETIDGPPADSAGYQFTRLGDGWAVQANSGGKLAADCGNCAGPALPVWYLANNAQSAARVGTANLVAPAASADALWLTSYPPGANIATTTATAREVGPTGALLRPPVTLPVGYAIVQGTDRGLLLTLASPQSGSEVDRLWNPGAGSAFAPGQKFDQVIAANATSVASATGCASACHVAEVNLVTGKRTVIRLPAGTTPSGGAFSPSGSYLALQLSSQDDDALAMQLEVASVATGTLARVPGTWVSSDALAGFGWPSGSDSLVAEFNFESTMQLTSWRPGASELGLAVIKPGPTQASLVIG